MPRRLSPAERARFLQGRQVAVLVTIGRDGAPVPTPIWYRFRGDVFYFRTESDAVKTENIRRDPRVSICVQDERPPYKAIVAYGKAEVQESPGWLAREMPRHYLGFVGAMGYQTARTAIELGPEVALVVRPERWSSFDFSAETPWFGRLWLQLRRVLPPWL